MLGFLPDFITKDHPTFPEHINIKESKRARRLSLRLNAKTGQFDLTLPKHCSLHEAYKFVQTQENWINQHLDKLSPNIDFTHGKTIPILGKDRAIHIAKNPHSARTKITLSDHEITMLTHLEQPQERLTKFLKQIAKDEFTTLAHEKAKTIDKTIKSITLRDTKSRWGSCSEDGKIMLSWRLILAPSAAMDYVIAHEVAHLVHMDHSKSFWSLCRDLSEDFLEGSHWMQENGNSLLRYG